MTQSRRLDGRVAIVTGASRGMGKAIAVTFAREGAAVAVVARTETEWSPLHPGTIHEVVDDITRAGGKAIAVAADLSRPEDIERVYETARSELGPVDLLVNNAALTTPGRPTPEGQRSTRPPASPASTQAADVIRPAAFVDLPLKAFRLHFEIGVFASYRLMQLVIPDMIESGRGGIVNIGSQAAFVPGEGPYTQSDAAGPIAYGANKAALQHLTQSVAVEMHHHGIAVNALLPSAPILTPGNLVAIPDETDWANADDFAEATVRVALADPAVTTGCVLWHDDVLHPELGKRGWLRPNPTS
ncbi:SDR family NAD(P)-dependent oxidoreductase [Mycolicibacterium sp. XJ1819]